MMKRFSVRNAGLFDAKTPLQAADSTQAKGAAAGAILKGPTSSQETRGRLARQQNRLRNDARITAQSTGPAPQRAADRFPYRRACQQALFYYNVPTT